MWQARHIMLLLTLPRVRMLRAILFHRSLEDNVRYGRAEASQKEVIEAAKLAHCDEFIKNALEGIALSLENEGPNFLAVKNKELPLLEPCF